MNRRSVLGTVGFLVSSGTAGCLSDKGSEPQCQLMHEIVESPEDYADPVGTYRYEELSNDAQHLFEEAVTHGSYSTTNKTLEPAEFRYWDTTTVYNVTFQNETYVLRTYTGSGCER